MKIGKVRRIRQREDDDTAHELKGGPLAKKTKSKQGGVKFKDNNSNKHQNRRKYGK